MRPSVNKSSHLKFLLKKNWIIWKFNKCLVFCELFIPVICMLLIILPDIINDEILLDTSYLNDPNYFYHFDGTLNATNQDVLEACNISKKNAMIGLAPEGDSLVKQLQDIFGKDIYEHV